MSKQQIDLIYDGLLSSQTTDWVLQARHEKPYMVEMSPGLPWDDFRRWANENLPKYPSEHEDCMGGSYIRESVSFIVIVKNGSGANGQFLGFRTEAEHLAVVDAFRQYVRNERPFKTVISIFEEAGICVPRREGVPPTGTVACASRDFEGAEDGWIWPAWRRLMAALGISRARHPA